MMGLSETLRPVEKVLNINTSCNEGKDEEGVQFPYRVGESKRDAVNCVE
jgi:hypothetical protein